MADEIDRNAQFVLKLIELSQRGQITWASHAAGGYEAVVFGRRVRALRIKRDIPAWMRHSFSNDQFRTEEIPVLEVYDDNGKVGYTFEGVAGLGNLVLLASYLGSKVNDLMAKVLAS